MVGLLQSIESPAGQTIGIIRENGQVEDCSLVDPATLITGSRIPGTAYVSAAAAAGGNGSIVAPFVTIAEAITALTADAASVSALLVFAGNYSAEPAVNWTGGSLFVGSAVDEGRVWQGTIPLARLPDFVIAGAVSQFKGVRCNVLTDTTGFGVTLQNCELAGAVTSPAGTIEALNCEWLTGSSSSSSNLRFIQSEFGVSTHTATGTLIVAELCTFSGVPTFVFSGAAGAMQVDTWTRQQAAAIVAVLTNGTYQVTSRVASATVSVVVPAVLAGQVGYVDTVLTGELAALVQDAPITGNPQADLVAAGAGGGFINCRVSAAGTVRCAFVGPLAGGAVNFTFSGLAG